MRSQVCQIRYTCVQSDTPQIHVNLAQSLQDVSFEIHPLALDLLDLSLAPILLQSTIGAELAGKQVSGLEKSSEVY